MFIALDSDKNRIHIGDMSSDREFFVLPAVRLLSSGLERYAYIISHISPKVHVPTNGSRIMILRNGMIAG